MKWVLLIMILSNNGVAIEKIEMTSEAACASAMKTISAAHDDNRVMRHVITTCIQGAR
jgi:hypothetical protein